VSSSANAAILSVRNASARMNRGFLEGDIKSGDRQLPIMNR